MTAAGASRAAGTVLAARTCPDAAVLVVALRGGHWPYSCGLASTVRDLAPRLSAGGAEVLLLAAESPQAREAIAAAWRLPFRWLPETAAETVARELGSWDEASGRVLDALGLLGPDGDWILRQNYDDPADPASPEAVLGVLRGAGLGAVAAPLSSVPLGPSVSACAGPAAPSAADPAARPHAGAASPSAGARVSPSAGPVVRPLGGATAPAPAGPVAAEADESAVLSARAGVRDPGQVAGILRRALDGADRLARSLPPSSPGAAKAERTRLRLALYLRAVRDLVPDSGPA
ncbi:hypothetical protein ACFYO0_36990 [Streptomyces sp. NPDC006365]|uniref:hypothetical protein n=1 Tax=Streptomyces sp. NPDC006365 TaxID=3364744 RepID=UPI0036AD714E